MVATNLFIKCVTCTGAIQAVNNGTGTGFTTLGTANCFDPATGIATAPTTSKFVRCNLNSGTITTQLVGLNIVNSGDSIIVDYAKVETILASQSVPTMPIATTTASVSNNADANFVTGGRPLYTALAAQRGYAVVCVGPVIATSSSKRIVHFNGGWEMQFTGNGLISDGTTTLTGTNGNGANTRPVAVGFYWDGANGAVVANAGTVTQGSNIRTTASGTLLLGDNGSSRQANGPIKSISVWPVYPSPGTLQTATAPTC